MTTTKSALDQLQRAAFVSIQFPVRHVSVKGGLRDHVHEFIKTPGGAPEKLGRRLYLITMEAMFRNNYPTYGDNLYPGDLADLFEAFEAGTTGPLVVPQLGTIQAYCFNWSRDLEAKIRSGENATFEFREDQSAAFLIEGLINIQSKDLSVVAASMFAEADALGLGDAFASLTSLIGSITGLVDLVELYGSLVMARLDGILGLFSVLDTTIPALQDQSNAIFIESFLAAWKATLDLHTNLLKVSAPVVRWSVPRRMSITDVSRILYGDASRATDLLSLNAVDDAFQIPANTSLLVWSPNALKAA